MRTKMLWERNWSHPSPPQSSTTSVYFVAKGQKISLFLIALITFKALQRVLFSCAPTVHVSFDFDICYFFFKIPQSNDGKDWWEYIDPSVNKSMLDGMIQ